MGISAEPGSVRSSGTGTNPHNHALPSPQGAGPGTAVSMLAKGSVMAVAPGNGEVGPARHSGLAAACATTANDISTDATATSVRHALRTWTRTVDTGSSSFSPLLPPTLHRGSARRKL